MRYYESLYIVNPNYEQERLDEVIKAVADKSIELGFSIINHRVWGKKRLAYSIEKHKYGSFILLQFETESITNLADFERFMILQKTILRNQTVTLSVKPEVQIEEKPVKSVEQKETTEDSAVVNETKEEKKEDSKEVPPVENEIVVETKDASAEDGESEEKAELPIEEEVTEEVTEEVQE
jgi:small subunit ribosomal protein S6